VRRLPVLVAAVAAGLLAPAAPAAAAPSGPVPQSFSDCPPGYGCFWTGASGTGIRWVAPSCGIWVFSGPLNNAIDSVRNRGGGTVHLYDGADARTGYITSVRNNGVGVNLPYRDRVSSIRIDC
jgi:hypothetical protein